MSNPFTPQGQYTRMVDDDGGNEHNDFGETDIELAEARTRSTHQATHAARHVGFVPVSTDDQSPPLTSETRPSLSRLSIPSSNHVAREADLVLSPDTPGALRRIATFARKPTTGLDPEMAPTEIALLREQEFFSFLDRELQKVEEFYAQKETQSEQRLQVLRQQLHIMRTRQGKRKRLSGGFSIRSRSSDKEVPSHFEQAVPFTSVNPSSGAFSVRDYVKKRSTEDDVSYRNAKQKLRLALQEYYRGLQLLKSYALLNLTAFRKLLKKCDTSSQMNGRSGNDYMTKSVLNAEFVKSNTTEDYVEQVEDLYTRYFENGNRKMARTKLRRLASAEGDKAQPAFLNGVLIGVGLTFAVEGVVLGVKKLSDEDADVQQQTSFLLQMYAGYFLILYLFTWFCLCCRIWNHFKVNYSFIFEFDPKHDLNWKKLSNFPSFLTLLMGLIIWLKFSDIGMDEMFLWYPVLLIGTTLILIFLPLPVLYWRSRRWFVVAHVSIITSTISY